MYEGGAVLVGVDSDLIGGEAIVFAPLLRCPVHVSNLDCRASGPLSRLLKRMSIS